MSSGYQAFKEAQAVLEVQLAVASQAFREVADEAFRKIPRGPMGLTPDPVKAMPEYQAAKAAYDAAFAALRDFNGKYVKIFKAEIQAERREKYK